MTHLEEKFKKQLNGLIKENDRIRDEAQVRQLDHERISKEHKRYVGELLKELDAKDKKIQDLLSNNPHKLRKLGII